MKHAKILLALLLVFIMVFSFALPAMASPFSSFMGQQQMMRAFPVLFMTPLQLLWHGLVTLPLQLLWNGLMWGLRLIIFF